MMQEGHGHTVAIHLHLALPVWGIVLGHAASDWGNYTLNQQLPTYLHLLAKTTFYIVHDAGKTRPYPGDPSSPRCWCGALFWATRPPTGGTTRWTNSCPPIYVLSKDDILNRP
jgi:hypothetical protein